MPDENTGLPLEALQEMKTPEADGLQPPAGQPAEPTAEQPAEPAAPETQPTDEAQTPPESTDQTPTKGLGKGLSKIPGPKRPAAGPASKTTSKDPVKTAKKLVFIVLIEAIFILPLIGLDVYLAFFKVPALNKQIQTANKNLKDANVEIAERTQERDNVHKSNKKLTEENKQLCDDLNKQVQDIKSLKDQNVTLTDKKADLEINLSKLSTEKTKLDEELARLDTDYKKLDKDFKGTVDQKNELEKKLDEVNKKINKIQNDYEDLKASIILKRKADNAKRLEWEKEYTEKYAPAGLKMVEQLNQLANAIKVGMNYKTYRDMLKELEVPYEEFKIPLNETSFKNPSFKLISSAYNTHKEVEERWKNIIRANPNDEKWRDKIFKLENPITTNRPWTDQIQELWRDAVAATLMAGLLIENKEQFPDKCIFCDGKEKLACLTCGGSGKCVSCTGTGYNDKNAACPFCNASGKCPLCLGTMFLPCKICILRNIELENNVKSEPKIEIPPASETPKEAPKTEPPKETPPAETPKETPPEAPKETPPETPKETPPEAPKETPPKEETPPAPAPEHGGN